MFVTLTCPQLSPGFEDIKLTDGFNGTTYEYRVPTDHFLQSVTQTRQ